MDRVVSPLRYPGGKSLIFPFVSSFLRENNLIGSVYAEPFAGGAGLALALLYNDLVSKIYINDLDRAIYSFWHTALNDTEDFCDWISKVPITIRSWRRYHETYFNSENASEAELAKATFFLNRTNVSGIIKGGVIGGLDQSGSYKIDARFNRESLIRRIMQLNEHKKNIILSNLDAIDFLKRRERMIRSVFVYLDPPYYQKASNLYMNYYRNNDHERLAQMVLKMNKQWMVSYDNQSFIHNLYSEQSRLLYSLQQSTSNRVGKEVLIFKADLHFKESMQCLKNATILE